MWRNLVFWPLLTRHAILSKSLNISDFLHLLEAKWLEDKQANLCEFTLRTKRRYYWENCYWEVKAMYQSLGRFKGYRGEEILSTQGFVKVQCCFSQDAGAECNGVGYTIAWVVHLPVRKTIVFFLLPKSCECEKIPYYCRLTSIDQLIIPAIHYRLTAWAKNKLRGRWISVSQRKRTVATYKEVWVSKKDRPVLLPLEIFTV